MVNPTPPITGIENNPESVSTTAANRPSSPVSEESSDGRDQAVTEDGNAGDAENGPVALHDATPPSSTKEDQAQSTRLRKPTVFYQHPC